MLGFGLSVVISLSSTAARADEPTTPLKPNRPSPEMDAPDPWPNPPPPPTREPVEADSISDLLIPTPHEWRLKYEAARSKLLTGEFADAAVLFAELESSAVNRVDRATAHEQRTLADEWTARNLAFVHRADLADLSVSAKAVDRRSTDELVSLYTNSVLYGIGSGVWLATLTDPQTAAGGILPTIALTAGSIGTVLALDSGRGFRYGVPQSIVSGLYIGLEHGIVWSAWANSRETHPDLDTKATSTIVWTLSTIGAVGGGVLGEALGTTPGRSGWVGSVALWTGALAGFTTGGLVRNGGTEALALAGVGLSTGTMIGLATASSVSPSISRVRLIDLSGVLGGVTTAALYVATAQNSGDGQAASGLTALGIAGGLAVGWFATNSMTEDRLRTSSPAPTPTAASSTSVSASASTTPTRARGALAVVEHLRPMLLPTPSGGAMIGALGTID